jgi:serine phosphatase RsbU (regulator of sigma subunit)
MERGLVNRWLTWLMFPAAVALVVSALTFSRHAYTGVSVQGDRVATVDAGSPGERAGLRPGDRIAPGPSSGPVNPLDPDPLHPAQPGRPLVVLRERDGRSDAVWLAPEALPDGERRYKAFLLAVSSVFVLLAGWVWSERRDHLTRVFVLLGLSFAGMLAPPPWLPPGGWQMTYELGVLAAQVYVSVLFMHFFALFPEPAPRPRAQLLVKAGYGFATTLLLALAAVVAETVWGAGRWREALPFLSAAHLALFAAGMAGGLTLFAISFVRARDADARRRLRVAFFGTLLGAAPFAAIVAWRNLSPGSPLPGDRLVVATTLLVPASFAWAIAIHRVFDFRVALRAAVTLATLALVGFAVYAFGEWMAASWWPALGRDVSGVSLAFLALVAALAGPTRTRLAAIGAHVVPIVGEVSLVAWAPSEEAARSADTDAMLLDACGCVRQALRLDGCGALTVDGGALRLAAHAGEARAGASLASTLSAGFLDAMARAPGPRGLAELDLADDDRDALELAGVHWTLAVPGSPVAAVLLLGRRFAGAWLDRQETADLDRLAHHLAVALENTELRREARHRAAYERELREAHHVQLHRLPRRTPVYPTLDCAAVTLSTESVGGDYYDFIEAGVRDFTLAVGDAAGHGVPAALVLAGVQSRFRDLAQRARQPGDLLEALNHDLVAHEQPERFMGLLCARVDVSRAVLRFANAGLTPPLVRRASGRLEEVSESGLLLGVSAAATYGTATVELDAGDLVLVYTDGLTEASRRGRMFGVEGAHAVLDRHAHRRASDVVEELLAAVRRWADEPLDDLTLVVLKQLSRPPSRNRLGDSALKPTQATADTVL